VGLEGRGASHTPFLPLPRPSTATICCESYLTPKGTSAFSFSLGAALMLFRTKGGCGTSSSSPPLPDGMRSTRTKSTWTARVTRTRAADPSSPRAIEPHTTLGFSLQSVRPLCPLPTPCRAVCCRQKGESPKRECRYTQPWPLVPIGTCIRRSPSRTRPQVPEHAPPRRLLTGRITRTKST
jgi:hypothetical protein